MIITGIAEWHKGKYLISLNDEPAFALYGKEIGEYGLKEGAELSDEEYRRILDDVLIKRTKSRTLHILDKNDKTEKELRDKLKEGMYPEEAIDAAVEAAKRGRFLDDKRYAYQYVYEKSRTKSRRMIEAELKRKGISEDLISTAFSAMDEEEGGEDREEALILKLIKKRLPDPGALDNASKDKMYRYLTGKGFEFEKCRRVLDRYLSGSR